MNLTQISSNRCAYQAKALSQKAPSRQVSRQQAKVNASLNESRRNVIALMGLSFAPAVFAQTDIQLFDDRAGRSLVESLDQARELSLPQDVRDGFEQFRKNIQSTRDRIDESVKRINGLSSNIDKKYWTDLKSELRRQIWYLRLDLNTLTANKPKDVKKQANSLKKDLYAKIDKLDYAATTKSQEQARKALSDVQEALSKTISFLS